MRLTQEEASETQEEEEREITEQAVTLHDDEEDNEDILLTAKFPHKMGKRGNPKGSVTTAIGLPRNKGSKTEKTAILYFRKTTQNRAG